MNLTASNDPTFRPCNVVGEVNGRTLYRVRHHREPRVLLNYWFSFDASAAELECHPLQFDARAVLLITDSPPEGFTPSLVLKAMDDYAEDVLRHLAVSPVLCEQLATTGPGGRA